LKFRRQKQEEVSVNLTPLIDVVFLLLIFFMVSTTFSRETQLQIDLPEADVTDQNVEKPRVIEIVITADGQMSVNGQGLVNSQADTLGRALKKVAGSDRQQPLTITADASTPHQSVVTAMEVAGNLGFSKLSITTQEHAR